MFQISVSSGSEQEKHPRRSSGVRSYSARRESCTPLGRKTYRKARAGSASERVPAGMLSISRQADVSRASVSDSPKQRENAGWSSSSRKTRAKVSRPKSYSVPRSSRTVSTGWISSYTKGKTSGSCSGLVNRGLEPTGTFSPAKGCTIQPSVPDRLLLSTYRQGRPSSRHRSIMISWLPADRGISFPKGYSFPSTHTLPLPRACTVSPSGAASSAWRKKRALCQQSYTGQKAGRT